MSSVSQLAEVLEQVLNEEACHLARETGFIERERTFDGADFAQSLIFGWLQEPEIRLEGLIQVLGRRQVQLSAPGLSQRFTEACAIFFQRLLERLSAMQMQAEEAVDCALLRRFGAVIVEDSSSVQLPTELATVWRGCGGSAGATEATIKLFVRWDVLNGEIWGPTLTDGRCNDHRSPFAASDLPARALYLADLGFFGLERIRQICQRQGRDKRYVVSRLQPGTSLWTRSGHQINLGGILPKQVGEARELGVLVGKTARLPMRLILVRVPKEAALQRRKQLREAAQDHGREPGEEALFLADWTIVITNVPKRLASLPEVLVLMRLRWQIERLFRLWKSYGFIDEWRSKKPYRVLSELYAKLCAMLIQQWLIHEGCWDDPHRSLVKAAQVVRREINRLMVALSEGGVEPTLVSILRLLGGPGCRLNRRKQQPGTDQLLLEGLEWPIVVLT
jgi:hypothetical protein